MKKYILWLMITWLSIVSFTLADSIEISCNNKWKCTPYGESNPIAITENWTLKITDEWTCDQYQVQAVFNHSQYWESVINQERLMNWQNLYPNSTVYFRLDEENKIACTFTVQWLPAINEWWNEWTWWNEWWNTWWSTEWWTEWWIVSWWINAFSWITERLWNIAGEFLPYMVYIAIGCLWIALLFKALKYLLWFTNNQSKNSISGRSGMQERRTYRRKMRRRRKYDNEDYRYKYYTNKWISKKWASEQAKYMKKNRRRIRKNNWAY